MRSDAADSLRETVRMKGEQSREVGSRESQREGVEERREARAREGWKGGVLGIPRLCPRRLFPVPPTLFHWSSFLAGAVSEVTRIG